MVATSVPTALYLLEVLFLSSSTKTLIPRIQSEIEKCGETGLKVQWGFKVVGEHRLLYVFETSSPESIDALLLKLPSSELTTTCNPIYKSQEFARDTLQVDPNIILDSPTQFSPGGYLMWLEVTIGYRGKTLAEITSIVKAEAEAVYGAMATGLEVVLYKQVSSLKVYFAIRVEHPKQIDSIAFTFPLFVQNGDQVEFTAKSIQPITDFVKGISHECPNPKRPWQNSNEC